jgi:ferrous iron transport protein A
MILLNRFSEGMKYAGWFPTTHLEDPIALPLDLQQASPRIPLASTPPLPYRFPNVSRSPEISDAVQECLNAFVCPLNEVAPGTVCRVRQLLASPELARRLRELGFCEDQKIRLLSQQRMMICQVCNARLGLSEKLARAILVEPVAKLRQAS